MPVDLLDMLAFLGVVVVQNLIRLGIIDASMRACPRAQRRGSGPRCRWQFRTQSLAIATCLIKSAENTLDPKTKSAENTVCFSRPTRARLAQD
jgi:hypothetical protein